ncbi:MAG: hypothetical protein JJT96_16580 [Opitutales bacterium]|nr:hypothetical protein [Opitutales bacterium]
MTLSSLEILGKQALSLPERERASLATRILDSLPPLFAESDGGEGEARRRDEELTTHPERGLSIVQLEEKVRSRRER